MKIDTFPRGLVNIESKDFSFAFNKNMYRKGETLIDGVGIQLREGLEEKEGKIKALLCRISELTLELDEVVNGSK